MEYLLKRGKWYYDPARGLPKECRNPLTADHARPLRNTTKELKKMCMLNEEAEANERRLAQSDTDFLSRPGKLILKFL